MAELQGTIHIKDGKVDRLSLSGVDQAVDQEGDAPMILSDLSSAGWILTGNYTLALTNTEETVEERKSLLVSESMSDTRPLSRVSGRRNQFAGGPHCKMCDRYFPEDVLDSLGYCPSCVENSYCRACGTRAHPQDLEEGMCASCRGVAGA
jgi:hypothetical protein